MSTSSIPFTQILVPLGIVLALIWGLAWFLKRWYIPKNKQGSLLKVRSQLMLGPREKIILLEIGDQWLVVGVSSTGMYALGQLVKSTDSTTEEHTETVVDTFKQYLQRSQHPPS